MKKPVSIKIGDEKGNGILKLDTRLDSRICMKLDEIMRRDLLSESQLRQDEIDLLRTFLLKSNSGKCQV